MELAYVMLEVGGIQNYICGTGKLKEMIGGSEIIESLSREFYEEIRDSQGLRTDITPFQDPLGVFELQRNAGTLCLALRPAAARCFLLAFSEAALERFPGLPLFGASAPFAWSGEGLKKGRRAAGEAIHEQRGRIPVPAGLPTLPVTAVARLDGMPAVDYDGDERVSLPSRARRNPKVLCGARERLRRVGAAFADKHAVALIWKDDLAELLGGETRRVALIHMDGNDLGRLFTAELGAVSESSPTESVKRLQALSTLVVQANEAAFRAGLERVLDCEMRRLGGPERELVVPLRPLVLGGDDITVLVRADLALPFIHTFVRTFERVSTAGGKPLTLGVGMVVMPASYPFVKAFTLVDDLLKSAKKATKDQEPRRSSLDYLVLAGDVETELDALRRRVCTAEDGSRLSAKPLVLHSGVLQRMGLEADMVLRRLPRSHIRPAMNACRKGQDAARRNWENLRDNLSRGLGGRMGEAFLSVDCFTDLFPDGYFKCDGQGWHTPLGDYLEWEHLLPSLPSLRDFILKNLLAEPVDKPEASHA